MDSKTFKVDNYITSNNTLSTYTYINKEENITEEKQLEQVEEFIKKYNIETEGDYVYLFKAVNNDGTNIYSTENKIIYEVGKVYTEKVDKNIHNDCSYGLHASTLEFAIDFAQNNKSSNLFGGTISVDWATSISLPSLYGASKISDDVKNNLFNPKSLYENNFKVYKVKINKKHIVVPFNNNGKIRCSQMEIIKELKFENKLNYKIRNLEYTDDKYKYTFTVYNKLNNKSTNVSFCNNTLNINENDIRSNINNQLEIMQEMHDNFEKFHGEL